MRARHRLASPELIAKLPRHQINLQPTLAVPDLGAGEADAVLLYGVTAPADPRLHVEALARPRVFPVASPAFLDRHPSAGTLAGLAGAPLLHEESTCQWEEWLALAGHAPAGLLRGQRLWHAHLAVEAARLGQGIALANELLVVEELAEGTLREPLPSEIRMGDYRLVTTEKHAADPALRALSRWLSEVLRPAADGALKAPKGTEKLMVGRGVRA